jgi:hypothetical protein
MWPFSRKRKQAENAPVMSDILGDRNLFDLSQNGAELRVWLPEEIKKAFDEIISGQRITAAKYIREFFVLYLYGMHELLKMQQNHKGLYHNPPPKPKRCEPEQDSGIRYSRAPSIEFLPGLGKNIVPLKIFIPERIKDDLQILADRAGIPLSRFTREVLASHFFGHTFFAEKLKTWSDDQDRIGVEWEEGIRESERVYSYDEAQGEENGVVQKLREY